MSKAVSIILGTLLVFALGVGPLPAQTDHPVSPPSPSVSASDAADKVVKVLRTTNKAQTNRYVCGVFEFKNVNPYNVINYFAAALIREEGGVYSFVGPDGKSGKILVICPEYQLDTFAKAAQLLDRPDITSAPKSEYLYLRLAHRSVSDADFITILRQYANFSGTIEPDIETNSIMIWDSKSGAAYCKEALEKTLDTPSGQVLLNVKMYEVDSGNDGRLGLDYEAWKNGPGQQLFSAGANGSFVKDFNSNDRSSANARQGAFILDYPSEFFDFLVEKGRAKLLTSTEIAAVNGKDASLFAGDAILYFQETTGAGNYRTVEQQVARPTIGTTATGVSLKVSPTISEKMVNMKLDVSILNHLGYAEDGSPRVGARTISQEIRAADEEEVMLGGLARERTIKETAKVPILGSIPILGYLFGGETQSVQRSTVMIALRPKIAQSGNSKPDQYTEIVSLFGKESPGAMPKTPVTPVGFDQWLLGQE